MALSNKRRWNAITVGEAYAKTFMKDFTNNPSHFGNNFENLPNLAGRMAYVGLYTTCSWEPSDQEKEICQKACEELIKISLNFHKKIVTLP